MQENLKIFALGGLDENGKSLYVINYNEQLYIFDAGLRYPEEKLLGIDIILPDYQYVLDKGSCTSGRNKPYPPKIIVGDREHLCLICQDTDDP